MNLDDMSAEEADELINREPGTVVQDIRHALLYRFANNRVEYGGDDDWIDAGWENLQLRNTTLRYRVFSRLNPQPATLTGAQALERSARTGEAFTYGRERRWFKVCSRGLAASENKGVSFRLAHNWLEAIVQCNNCRMVNSSEWWDAKDKDAREVENGNICKTCKEPFVIGLTSLSVGYGRPADRWKCEGKAKAEPLKLHEEAEEAIASLSSWDTDTQNAMHNAFTAFLNHNVLPLIRSELAKSKEGK